MRYLIFVFLYLAHSNANVIQTNLIRDPTFPGPTSAPAPAQLNQNPGCAILGQALGICITLTPDFTTLLPVEQAHCLCYSSTVWLPNVFDNAVKSCAEFALTAAVIAYPPLANLEGFCNNIGNVVSPAAISALTTGGASGSWQGGNSASTTFSNYNSGVPTTLVASPSIPKYAGPTSAPGSSGSGGHGGSGNGDGSNGAGSGSGTGGIGCLLGTSRSSALATTASASTLNSGNGFGLTIVNGVTITAGAAATTSSESTASRAAVTDSEVILVSLAITLLILFL